jgi:hypothetical protein
MKEYTVWTGLYRESDEMWLSEYYAKLKDAELQGD